MTEKRKSVVQHALNVLSVIMVLYHLAFSQFVLQSPIGHQNIHLGFSLLVLFLSFAEKKEKSVLHLVLLVLSLIAAMYVQINIEELENRAGMNTRFDLFIGVLLIVLCLMGTWMAFGPILPILACFFILYAYFGHYLPQPLTTTSLYLDELISKMSIGLSGIYGEILGVSANFIFLFMVFSALMNAAGIVPFFTQFGKLVGRLSNAGPAMAAIITSGFVGSITGASGVNVMITGSFTIPAMKERGYNPNMAAGIEAAASTAGPIIPPVMGVVAFLMSAVTGIAYATIIKVAVIPAILYVISCCAFVELQARKMGFVRVHEEVDMQVLLSRLPLFLASLGVIVFLFLLGKSPMFVGCWACLTVFFISFLTKGTRLSLWRLLEALEEGAVLGARVGLTCAVLGLIVSSIVSSGLGIKLPLFVGDTFGGNLPLLLIMTAVLAIVLGCGLPAAASYLLCVIAIVPIMLKLGIDILKAHLFVFYFANFSFITPPVALSALYAANLAKTSYIPTSIEAAKVGLAGFILPFIIIYCPAVLGDFSAPLNSTLKLFAMTMALIGLQIAIIGYSFKNLKLFERAAYLVASFVLLAYLFTNEVYFFFAGIGLGLTLFLYQGLQRKKLFIVRH